MLQPLPSDTVTGSGMYDTGANQLTGLQMTIPVPKRAAAVLHNHTKLHHHTKSRTLLSYAVNGSNAYIPAAADVAIIYMSQVRPPHGAPVGTTSGSSATPSNSKICVPKKATDSAEMSCSAFCKQKDCGHWCKCSTCQMCMPPLPPPPPSPPLPSQPPRACASAVSGDAGFAICSPWCD